MSLNYDSLIAYIDGLYADMNLSPQEYNDIINYILADGDIENAPRDLIQVRRGNKADLPTLAQGEGGTTLDTKELYYGGIDGNFRPNSLDLINAKWYGVKADGTDETTLIQNAINDNVEGTIIIPKGTNFDDELLTLNDNITLLDFSIEGVFEIISNGVNNSGLVNEFIFKAGYHPGITIDVDKNIDTGPLGIGQVVSNRASLIYRVDGIGKWQIANDQNASGENGLTIYKLDSSRQMMHFNENGNIRYGRLSSRQDYSAPVYNHIFEKTVCIEEDDGTNPTLVMRTVDGTGSAVEIKVIKMLSTTGDIQISNAGGILVTISDDGHLKTEGGINGGSYTTNERNGLSVNNIAEQGTMVFDSQLGKPIWYNGTDWIDATGVVV